MTNGHPENDARRLLPRDEVHLWTIPLDPANWRDAFRLGWLSPDELQRAHRFAFECEQRRFAVCRATVRAILGGYLGRAPGELRFDYGPHGKPRLVPANPGDSVYFNVSHSHEVGLVAVSPRRELG